VVRKSNPNFNPSFVSKRRHEERMQESKYQRMLQRMLEDNEPRSAPTISADGRIFRKLPKRLQPHVYRTKKEVQNDDE